MGIKSNTKRMSENTAMPLRAGESSPGSVGGWSWPPARFTKNKSANHTSQKVELLMAVPMAEPSGLFRAGIKNLARFIAKKTMSDL